MRKIFDCESDVMSKTISWLRFPLIILVVATHCHNNEVQEVDWQHIDDHFLLAMVTNMFNYSFSPSHIFFVISGFLFFYHVEIFDQSIFFRKIRSRLRSLLSPYLIWNTLPILWCVVMIAMGLESKLPVTRAFLEEQNWHLYWDALVYPPYLHPINTPLWYVRDLIVISLCTSIIYILLKRTHGWILFAGWFVYIMGWRVEASVIRYDSIICFSLGAFMAINKLTFILQNRTIRNVLMCVLPLWLLLSSTLIIPQDIHYMVLHLVEPLLVLSVMSIGAYFSTKDKGEIMNHLGESTYFIYLTHDFHPIHYVGDKITDMIISSTEKPMLDITHYVLMIVIRITICLALYALLKRLLPRVLQVLTGGKIGKK